MDKEVVMAKRVSARWVNRMSAPEYRFQILLGGQRDLCHLPSFLKSFRDGKVRVAGVAPIHDLGVRDAQEYVEVWSRRGDALVALSQWLEKRGYETTGVW